MAECGDTLQDLATDLSMGTAQLPGRDVLDRAALRTLNVRSDWRGAVRFLSHGLTILVTGGLVHALRGELVLLVPVMLLHGFAIVTLFAPMHECVHMTAFRSRWLKRVIGWATGAASFYNSDYYRYYHHWHHRFTQDLAHDPELMRPKPRRHWFRLMSYAHEHNISGRYGCRESRSSREEYPCHLGGDV